MNEQFKNEKKEHIREVDKIKIRKIRRKTRKKIAVKIFNMPLTRKELEILHKIRY